VTQGNPESLRILAEISGKLDHALRAASARPGGEAPAGGAPDPATLEAMARLVAAGDVQQVVEATLDAVVAATGADRAFVMLLEEGRKLRFKGGRAIDQDSAATEGTQQSKTIIKKVITSGEGVLVADTAKAPVESRNPEDMTPRSILCAPFRRREGPTRVLGVLYLDTRAQVRPFSADELAMSQAIADAGAAMLVRLDNGGAVAPSGGAAEVQKLKENMHRLLDVGRAIGTTLVVDDLLAITLEKVLEVTKADRGFIMLLEAGKPVFKIGRAWNKKEGPQKKTFKLDESQFFFSRTIVGRALEEGRSICIKDTVGGDDAAPSMSIVQMELQSVMATPLREKGQTLGLIYVDSKASNREFDASDLELFEALAGQAAIALQNAILFSQAKERSRLESEIQIAARMQQDMCPQRVPVLPGIEVAGLFVPAKEVGGDYYDYVEDPHVAGRTLSLIVGDVSGKGLGAGIVAVMARCFLRSMITAYGTESPSNLLAYLNTILSAELKPGVFMTMLMAVWDAENKTIRYSSAGHEHLIVYRARTRAPEALKSGGTPLGISAARGGPTQDSELRLENGDALVLYSDGVTEAMNAASEEFSLERLLESVKRLGGRGAQEIVNGIAAEVKQFVGGADQSDDITLVVLKKA
jgi:serine phosphatase RsbU (regulator of sigma subunit)